MAGRDTARPRRRVLHVITSFPLSSGAAENTKLTLNRLDRSRFELFLGIPPGQTMEQELAPDVQRIPLRWLGRSVNLFFDGMAFRELLSLCLRHRFDIVHTHNAKDGILGRWAAYRAGTPAVVHTIHNVSFRASRWETMNALYASLERRAAAITHRLVTVSASNARDYLARGIGTPKQYQTIYSGLDLTRYADDGRTASARRAAIGLPNHPGPWVGWLGRFNQQKDPLTFVRAASLVMKAVPGVRFLVCGDDPLDASLEPATRKLAAELGVAPAMCFVGFQRDVATVLRSLELVMHSSRYEGMGRIVCEALACGVPVAGTAVDGVTEVIVSGERGGLLVAPEDPAALADAAVALLRDRVRAALLARAGREWVHGHLSVDRMIRDIEALYEELPGAQDQ